MLRVLDSRIVNAHPFPSWLVPGHAAFSAGSHQVFDPHIGKRATGHHAVITAPRAVTVEFLKSDAVFEEVFPRG